ncbi:PAS domain S-box protein (plasmid) [Devosia sp. A8/3-2]|nr:PAS domain S-box protein [Devosia sp. A8/3-2]
MFGKLIILIVPTNFVGVLLLGFLIINEQQRRWALMAYSESRAQLQAIANNAPGVLFQLSTGGDRIGRFSYVSGGAERVLGVPAEDIVGNPGTIPRMISQEATATIERHLKQSAETHRARSHEVEFTKPDGVKVWMRAAAEPRIDIHGDLVWDGSLFDITERKRSEQMKNDFISTVSHELRTPLTSIRGSLGLVAAGAAGELPPKVAGLIKIAHSNSERSVRLINDILDIEKIRIWPHAVRSPANGTQTAHRAVDRWQPRLSHRKQCPDCTRRQGSRRDGFGRSGSAASSDGQPALQCDQVLATKQRGDCAEPNGMEA